MYKNIPRKYWYSFKAQDQVCQLISFNSRFIWCKWPALRTKPASALKLHFYDTYNHLVNLIYSNLNSTSHSNTNMYQYFILNINNFSSTTIIQLKISISCNLKSLLRNTLKIFSFKNVWTNYTYECKKPYSKNIYRAV